MNKKLLSMMLIAALMVCNCMVAYGDTTFSSGTGREDGNGGFVWDWSNQEGQDEGSSKDVKAVFDNIEPELQVYNVSIEWGALEYKYEGSIQWDSRKGAYIAAGDSPSVNWTPTVTDGGKIEIKNSSTENINATIKYAHDDYLKDGNKVPNPTGGYLKVIDNVSSYFDELEPDSSNLNLDKTLTIVAPEAPETFVSGSTVLDLTGAPTAIRASSITVGNGIKLGTVTIVLDDPRP
ncbi:MAG: hypothetical protein E7262_01890 [Lachnospiraceae bacterium]|nr:hypothetical protein [Lachnospiraceae bacterium]